MTRPKLDPLAGTGSIGGWASSLSGSVCIGSKLPLRPPFRDGRTRFDPVLAVRPETEVSFRLASSSSQGAEAPRIPLDPASAEASAVPIGALPVEAFRPKPFGTPFRVFRSKLVRSRRAFEAGASPVPSVSHPASRSGSR